MQKVLKARKSHGTLRHGLSKSQVYIPLSHNHGNGKFSQMKGNEYWRDPFSTEP